MKIKFTEKKYGLPVSLNKEYLVLGYYTDWLNNKTEWHKITLFLDDNKMPQFLNATYPEDIEIEDSVFPFETSTEYFEDHTSIMPKEWNLQSRTKIDNLDFGWDQLKQGQIWAVTQFVEGLNKIGIQPNPYMEEIAKNDNIKIWYVKGIMNGLFETVCNYFAGCANTQYSFAFDEVATDSINLTFEDVTEVSDYQTELYERLYKQLIEYSDFGLFLNGQKEGKYLEEGSRYCLKISIKRIALTISSMFNLGSELRVFKHKLKFPWEYCLYFLTKEKLYRFYLGNLD